jgi:hypothetical protein
VTFNLVKAICLETSLCKHRELLYWCFCDHVCVVVCDYIVYRKVEQWATGTTLRQSGSRRTGRAHDLHDRRRREWAAAQRRPCSLCFLTSAALFFVNRPPGPDCQHRFLLWSSAAFEGEHSVKAIGSVARGELDSPRRQCTLSLNTPFSWVSRQPQHVNASTPTLLARYSSCRLLPFPEDEDAAERSPFSRCCQDPAWIADYHTHTWSQNTNITTPDINTAMSLGTLPYQDWRSL